jgi:hypothetical protein
MVSATALAKILGTAPAEIPLKVKTLWLNKIQKSNAPTFVNEPTVSGIETVSPGLAVAFVSDTVCANDRVALMKSKLMIKVNFFFICFQLL